MMAIKNCKECGKEVSSKAKQCPHCGAPQPKHVGIVGIIAVLFFGYIVYAAVRGGGSSSSPSTPSPASATSPQAKQPPLEVLSWRCDLEHEYVKVRGEVKNTSSTPMKNVMVVGELRTSGGVLVKSADALIDYNPIMPGQTSPFSALTRQNPEISKCGLAFKQLGGGAIAYVESKK